MFALADVLDLFVDELGGGGGFAFFQILPGLSDDGFLWHGGLLTSINTGNGTPLE